MKTTTTLVTVLAAASITAAAPTPANPDTNAELQKRDAKPTPVREDDSFSHVLVERQRSAEPPKSKEVITIPSGGTRMTPEQAAEFFKNCKTQ